MLNLGHRGFKGEYPENTLLSFEKAIEVGADGVEFDVHLSKDGEIVIIHDEFLDRTTDGQGFVNDFTLDELKKFNASKLYPQFEFQAIPTLREYFEYAKDKDLVTNIELKNSVFFYDGLEEKVNQMIIEYGLEENIIISSFNHYSIVKFKELNPDLKYGLLTETSLYRPSKYIKDLGVDYYHPIAFSVTDDLFEDLNEAGIGLNVWFHSLDKYYERICNYNVNAVITDYPNKIDEIKKKLK